MNIIIDTREKAKAITNIISEFDKQKIKHHSSKLIVADYMSIDNPKIYVDRKQNLNELCSNLSYKDDRFYREIRLAKELGITIVVVCEHGKGIKEISDVASWENPRLDPRSKLYNPKAISGRELMERIYRLHISYNVGFVFCNKAQTGSKIIEILGRKEC